MLVEGPPDGIADEPTLTYTMVKQRAAGLSPNTMYQQMAAVVMMLNWSLDQDIDVEARIGSCDLFSIEEIYSLKDELRRHSGGGQNRGGEVVGAGHFYNRCIYVRDYVVWQLERVIQRIPAREFLRAQEARRRLDDFHGMMTRDLPSPKVRNREGQDDSVQQAFLEAIRPGSPTNPFKPPYQVRNYCLLLLYHQHGLRRSEPLKVKGEDLLLHGPEPLLRLVARHDEIEDPRIREPRIKTQVRDLPLGRELVAAFLDLVADRRNYPGAKKTPYVFLARDGSPLAARTVNDMFKLLRERVPGLPSDFTTHHTRHNANDRFTSIAREEGWSEAQEKRNRNYQFGWNKNSDQGEFYTKRATREGASAASLALQAKSFEGEV